MSAILGGLLLAHLVEVAAADSTGRVPQVCVAQWSRPSSTCALSEPVVVRAVGRSPAQARKLALLRLRLTLGSLAQAARMEVAGTLAEVALGDLHGCPLVAEPEVRMDCMASSSYLSTGICFAELPSDPCFGRSTLSAVGPLWKAAEQVRAEACGAVGGTGDARGLRCQAACQSQITIRCQVDPGP